MHLHTITLIVLGGSGIAHAFLEASQGMAIAFATKKPHLPPSPSFSKTTQKWMAASISSQSKGPTINDNIQSDHSTNSASSNNNIRPLQQNWWPVTLVNALQKDRPNAIMVLGMRLVLFHNGQSWTCLDDQCPHRFAPLSEGRVILGGSEDGNDKNHIQCSYHGWEFDGCGACQCVPQAMSSKDPKILKSSSMVAYPVREECGILWVWTDPATASALAESIPLPLSPLLKRYYSEFGDTRIYMRDLPYGMEFLGENLADLSHLPFSHHSVGNLKRDLGGPLPFKMLSDEEKLESAQWELEEPEDFASAPENLLLPLFQIKLTNAENYDPIFMNGKYVNASLDVSFYDPCHVRYRRLAPGMGAYHSEQFMCPVDSGKSRIMVVDVLDDRKKAEATKSPTAKVGQRKGIPSPKALFSQTRQSGTTTKAFDTLRTHQMFNTIFDGDGIFLNMQGERMHRSGKTFRNYNQPYQADVLINAIRRYIDVAAKKSSASGHQAAAVSVTTNLALVSDKTRQEMLDRWTSHTQHCSTCQAAFHQYQQDETFWSVAGTGMVGAAGASTSALLGTFILNTVVGVGVPVACWPVLGGSMAMSIAGSILANQLQRKAAAKAQKFIFEDYVHAEK